MPDFVIAITTTALDTNPKIEQFWLSYIDALKRIQFENAQQVVELWL